MTSIFTCIKCKSPFDLAERSPRILPCNNSICLSCINASKRTISGFRIECTCDQNATKLHNINDISQLYPCELITNYLKTGHNFDTPVENLTKQLDMSRFSLNGAKYEASRHYDAMEMDIEIRAETLIGLIHEKRDQLLEITKKFRNQTDDEFDSIGEQHEELYNKLGGHFSKATGKLEAKDYSELNSLLHGFNKVQRPIEDTKSNIYHFVPNPQLLDSSLLGVLLNKSVDVIYSKIQNLNQLLDSQTHPTNVLERNQNEKIHRQYVIPINQDRTISIYFTSERSIHLELFDQTNIAIKTHVLTTRASYYPIFGSTSEHLVVSYLDDRSVTNVVLFDSELNQVQATQVMNLVESVFINKRNVVCTFVHKSAQCCQVFDLELNVISTFGQKLQADEPFFMKMIEDTKDFRAKKNATIFGMNAMRIYFYNTTEMVVMCRKTGEVLREAKKKPNSFFILDSNENCIEIDTIAKEILFRSADLSITGSNRYQFIATDVFLVEDQFLVFVDSKKRSLTFV